MQFASAFPEDLNSNLEKDIHPSQPVTSWTDAARIAGQLSAIDASNEYRLPTIAEWRYAFFLLRTHSKDSHFQKLEQMTEDNWEFATRAEMPTAKALQNEHDHSLDRESFVMTGSPPDSDEVYKFKYYACPIPATADDGIDEYTGVRFVLVPKPSI